MNRITYENKLRASGFEVIGKGLYANVFAKPGSDKVIKVAESDGWAEYAKWATEKGYAGKFAPKVYSLSFREDGDYYVAVMERLVDTISSIRLEGGRSSTQHQLYKALDHWGDHDFDGATDFEVFFNDLRDAGLKNDLHAGNVMVRKDGQVVVTDPSSRRGSSQFSIKSSKVINA